MNYWISQEVLMDLKQKKPPLRGRSYLRIRRGITKFALLGAN